MRFKLFNKHKKRKVKPFVEKRRPFTDIFSRYKLWGDLTWCFNKYNGWFRYKNVIARWNTPWNGEPHETILHVMYVKSASEMTV